MIGLAVHLAQAEEEAEPSLSKLEQVAKLGKPIYVTENGLPDADDDQHRQ